MSEQKREFLRGQLRICFDPLWTRAVTAAEHERKFQTEREQKGKTRF